MRSLVFSQTSVDFCCNIKAIVSTKLQYSMFSMFMIFFTVSFLIRHRSKVNAPFLILEIHYMGVFRFVVLWVARTR